MGTSPSSIGRAVQHAIKITGAAAIAVSLLSQAAEAAGRHAAFVIDANTGQVLHSDDADDFRYPASLTKMMTLYMLYGALEDGRVTLSTPMKVSAYASARPPTKLRLKAGSTLTVQEAILGLITLSANDASVVIAEHIGGTEARFAQMMTAKARQLGMSRTTFRNANGLPNEGQKTTARDMATLGIALREHFPKQFRYFATKSFNFRGRTINGHNRLVGNLKGVDGIKTGYINASGFNLVSSRTDGDRKIVGVVFGGNTAAQRDKEMANLLNKYMPLASTRSSGPLVAEKKNGARVVPEPVVASLEVPTDVPVPTPSNRKVSIDERIAEAYGSNAGDAVSRVMKNQPRDVVGRDAIRAALAMPRPAATIPASSPVTATAYGGDSRPVPPAAVPGGRIEASAGKGGPIDRAVASYPAGGWVVQIAATPDRDQAISMLSDARTRGGAALARAKAVTQAVGSGSQTLYRARFAGFASKTDANAACDALKKRSYKCFAIAD